MDQETYPSNIICGHLGRVEGDPDLNKATGKDIIKQSVKFQS